MSHKLYNENLSKKTNTNDYSYYSFLCFILLIIVSVVSVITLFFVIGINKDVDELKGPVVVTGEPIEEEDIASVPVETPVASESDNVLSSEQQLGESYSGAFSKELNALGLDLKEILNLDSYMGENYDGTVYTLETAEIAKVIPTDISLGEFTLDLKNTDGFSVLKDFCTESEDEVGKIYTVSENGEDYFFIRGLSDEIQVSETEHLHYNVAYFCIKDYEKGKALNIHYGGIGIDSTLTDIVNTFGKPTYIDIYQPSNDVSYIMMYYSKQNTDTFSIDEMSLIFEINDSAENGYFLSEVTASVF